MVKNTDYGHPERKKPSLNGQKFQSHSQIFMYGRSIFWTREFILITVSVSTQKKPVLVRSFVFWKNPWLFLTFRDMMVIFKPYLGQFCYIHRCQWSHQTNTLYYLLSKKEVIGEQGGLNFFHLLHEKWVLTGWSKKYFHYMKNEIRVAQKLQNSYETLFFY